MNRRIFILAFILISNLSFSQKAWQHPATLGISFSRNDFISNKLFGNFRKMDAGIGFHYVNGISRFFDYQASLTGMFPDSLSSKISLEGKKPLLVEGEMALRARVLKQQSPIQPFGIGGLGISAMQKTFGGFLSVGCGLQLNYKDVFLVSSMQYRYSLASHINNHFCYSIGIAGVIAKGKSRTKKTVGIAVSEVAVITAIVRDRDGDGIVDTADLCPDVAGMKQFQGCPDTDNDGIEDKVDQCPLIPGLARYHGCPIPDTDKDGVNDEDDSCINVPGSIQNHGCPDLASEIKAKLSLAAQHIFFETGSARLRPESNKALDEVVAIMNDYRNFSMIIEGHTDSVGTDSSNLVLSQNRANAVFHYLNAHGIKEMRMKAVGFGSTKPVAPNENIEGRAKNRRVELKLEG